MSKVVSASKTVGNNLASGGIMGFDPGPQMISGRGFQKTLYTSSTSITVPVNVQSITFKLWGAGGDGGLANAAAASYGDGGGGGFAEFTEPNPAGKVYYLSVGTHGSGGPGSIGDIQNTSGGNGGGMSTVHLFDGSYNIKAVAAGGGGGGGSNSGFAGAPGGGGGVDGTSAGSGRKGANGIGGAGGSSIDTDSNGKNFINPSPTLSVGGGGGRSAIVGIFSNSGGGGGGNGYGGGGGGQRPASGAGGGNYSANGTVANGSGSTPGGVADLDYPPNVGLGGPGGRLLTFGKDGAIVVIYNTFSPDYIGLPPEATASAAADLIVQAADNTVGDAGDLHLNAGTSVATLGSVIVRGASLIPEDDNAATLGSPANRWSTVYAATGAINTSDRAEKREITPSDLGLDFISRLSPVQYKFRDGIRPHYGFLAQDIKEVMDRERIDFAGYVRAETPGGEILGLRYSEFIAPMVRAIQELTRAAESDRLAMIEFSKDMTKRISDLELQLATQVKN